MLEKVTLKDAFGAAAEERADARWPRREDA